MDWTWRDLGGGWIRCRRRAAAGRQESRSSYRDCEAVHVKLIAAHARGTPIVPNGYDVVYQRGLWCGGEELNLHVLADTSS